MTAILYLYDDDGKLIEKRDVPPSDVRYSSSDGMLIEKTEYVFSLYRLVSVNKKDLEK